jgi:hypothetical protein
MIMSGESCDSPESSKRGCVSAAEKVNFVEHWDKVYSNSPEEKLGWYETDLTPTLELVAKTGLSRSAHVLQVGAGSTRLVDALLNKGYTHLMATDLSLVALNYLADRVGRERVKFVVDDLTHPRELLDIEPVDLWIDRAVLHFFTEETDQNTYFNLLKNKVRVNGFVILAEYNLDGASRCAGLPVHRYSVEMMAERLGAKFELIDSFDTTFIMPSGAERPYSYALFAKQRD